MTGETILVQETVPDVKTDSNARETIPYSDTLSLRADPDDLAKPDISDTTPAE